MQDGHNNAQHNMALDLRSKTTPQDYKTIDENSIVIGNEKVVRDTKHETITCFICSDTFDDRRTLLVHMLDHRGKKLHKCDHCTKAFATSDQLEFHSVTHSEEKFFECPICNRSFPHEVDLTEHVRSHTGQKPYQCKLCSYAFPKSIQLILHMKMQHRGDGKLHQCPICNKTFQHKSSFLSHSKTHDENGSGEYKCDICDEMFANKISLRIHGRSHTGEVVPMCATCNKSFISNSQLVMHMRVHTGEKPYVCHICQKEFTQNGQMRRHMKTHGINDEDLGEDPSRVEASDETDSEMTEQSNASSVSVKEAYLAGRRAALHRMMSLPAELKSPDGGPPVLQRMLSVGHETIEDVPALHKILVVSDNEDVPVLHKLLTAKRHVSIEEIENEQSHSKSEQAREKEDAQIIDEMTERETTYHRRSASDADINTRDKWVVPKFRRMNTIEHDGSHRPNTVVDDDTLAQPDAHNLQIISPVETQIKCIADFPFHCKICKKKFSGRAMLMRHMNDHTREAPYICKLCALAFSQRSHFTFHLMSAHTEKLTCNCKLCTSKFRELLDCTKFHDINECGTCAKAAELMTALGKHMSGHTAQTQRGCQVCSRSMAEARALINSHLDIEHKKSSISSSNATKIPVPALPPLPSLILLPALSPEDALSGGISQSNDTVKDIESDDVTTHDLSTSDDLEKDVDEGYEEESALMIDTDDNEDDVTDTEELYIHIPPETPTDKDAAMEYTYTDTGDNIPKSSASNDGASKDHLAVDNPLTNMTPKLSQNLDFLAMKEYYVLNSEDSQNSTDSQNEPQETEEPMSIDIIKSPTTNEGNKGSMKYHCIVCSEGFAETENVIAHFKTHTDKKFYYCRKCTKGFANKSLLKTHVKSHAIDNGAYQCKICSKTFIKRSKYTRHKKIHRKAGSFKCADCKKTFSHRYQLTKHTCVQMAHAIKDTRTTEKPKQCGFCSKTFSENSSFIAHMKTHNSDKPYKCDKCDETFYMKENLRKHMKIHKHECMICHKWFSCEMRLSEHINTHAMERSTKKKPKRRKSATSYVKIPIRNQASERKKYKCTLCSSAFTFERNLVAHMEKHETCGKVATVAVAKNATKTMVEELLEAQIKTNNPEDMAHDDIVTRQNDTPTDLHIKNVLERINDAPSTSIKDDMSVTEPEVEELGSLYIADDTVLLSPESPEAIAASAMIVMSERLTDSPETIAASAMIVMSESNPTTSATTAESGEGIEKDSTITSTSPREVENIKLKNNNDSSTLLINVPESNKPNNFQSNFEQFCKSSPIKSGSSKVEAKSPSRADTNKPIDSTVIESPTSTATPAPPVPTARHMLPPVLTPQSLYTTKQPHSPQKN